MGTWAQVSRGQCWVQTLLLLMQRQLSQASCHSDPGWGEWGEPPLRPSPRRLFCYPTPALSPAGGPGQGSGLRLASATRVSGGEVGLRGPETVPV